MSIKTQKNIGLKELRENMESYIERVNKGESLTIYRRSTPLFRITPIESETDENWETVVDFVKETGAAMPLKDLLQSIKKYGQKSKVS
ncbi:type II toxin-antitoxin system prevent-host-death family antitoxin [Patescibacteria group bacterium]|nr:type II toxin-antitoxin system prevent-host-death family antitoxin [Patescibacteria group bacterium]